MSEAWDDYRRLLAGESAFVLPGWSVIKISGSDWREWLQGQVTNDVRKLTAESPLRACICKPTGQLLSLGELQVSGEDVLFFVPSATVSVVLERIESMVILEDVLGELLPDRVAWTASGFALANGESEVCEDGWRLFSLERKMPNWDYDVQHKTLPPELGAIIDERFVSYNKGCYTGQEVLQRIHSRGHTNRTWTVVKSDTAEVVQPGFEQTNCCQHPDGHWLVAGYQRNNVPTEP
jgi:folate-binding protein YgfZ